MPNHVFDESFTAFMRSLGDLPLLSREEERELLVMTKSANIDERNYARDRLIERNQKLVVSLALQCDNSGVAVMDLIMAGNIGLVRAIDMYELTTNNKLSSYAYHWVNEAIQRCIDNEGRMIRLPVYISEKIRKLKKAYAIYEVQNGSPPDNQMLETLTGIAEKEIEDLMRISMNIPVSMDTPLNDDNPSRTYGEGLTASVDSDMLAEVMRSDVQNAVREAINSLDSKTRAVIEHKFGLRHSDLSVEEFVKMASMSVSSYRAYSKKGIETLQKQLKPQMRQMKQYL